MKSTALLTLGFGFGMLSDSFEAAKRDTNLAHSVCATPATVKRSKDMALDNLIGKRFQGHPWHQAMVMADNQGILKADAAEFRTLTATTGLMVAQQVKVLHYEEGNVTTCPIGGATVTTGKMSGCLLFKCTVGGHATVGHVGTGSGTESVNDEVKRVLKAFAARDDVMDLQLDDPNSHWTDTELGLGSWASMNTRPSIIAGWDPGGQYFTCVMQQHDGGDQYTIIQMKTPQMQPWSQWENHSKLAIDD